MSACKGFLNGTGQDIRRCCFYDSDVRCDGPVVYSRQANGVQVGACKKHRYDLTNDVFWLQVKLLGRMYL